MHLWCGDKANGETLALYCEKEETTYGYTQLFKKMFYSHGAPLVIRGDNRTSFYSSKRNETPIDYCLSQLDIEVQTSSVSQFKPNVELNWKIMQQNLPYFFYKNSIKSIDDFNNNVDKIINFLNNEVKQVKKINQNCFRPLTIPQIENAFFYAKEATILSGNVLKINNKYVAPFNSIIMRPKGKLFVYKKMDLHDKSNFYIKDENGEKAYLYQIDRDINFEAKIDEDSEIIKLLKEKDDIISSLKIQNASLKETCRTLWNLGREN